MKTNLLQPLILLYKAFKAFLSHFCFSFLLACFEVWFSMYFQLGKYDKASWERTFEVQEQETVSKPVNLFTPNISMKTLLIVLVQLTIYQFIFFTIFITCLLDIVLIL